MTLTKSERTAGRKFRDGCQQKLIAMQPPAAPCSPFIREYRHACPAAAGVSVAIRMREHREESPEYWACYCSSIEPYDPPKFPHEDCSGGKLVAPAGMFAFLWVDGKCPKCALTARSPQGRLVLGADSVRDGR